MGVLFEGLVDWYVKGLEFMSVFVFVNVVISFLLVIFVDFNIV